MLIIYTATHFWEVRYMADNRDKFANVCNIIFDLDGTLIDSSSGIIAAARGAFERLGLPSRSDDEIKKCIGFPLELLYGDYPADDFEAFKRIFRQIGNHVIVNAARPFDGVEMTMSLLAANGHRLALATSKCRKHLESILSRLGWVNYFAAVSGGDDVSEIKPDPEQVKFILHELGAKKEQTVMVGDTVNDILAARAAGVFVIGIRSPFGNDSGFMESEPDLVLDTFCQLTEYLI